MPRGGARVGAGRPRKSVEQHRRAGTHAHYDRPRAKSFTVRPLNAGPRHPDFVPGLGRCPDVAALLAVIDETWTDELEAAWPSESPYGYVNVCEPRIVARHAVAEHARQWRHEQGPEWAASRGIPTEVIVEHFGRGPERRSSEPWPPPTPDDVRELLSSGWLLRYWTRTLTANDVNG